MASPQREDFKSTDDFLERFQEVLLRKGTQSPEAQGLFGLANSVPEWWPPAREMFERRLEFEKTVSERLGLPVGVTTPAPVPDAPSPLVSALLVGVLPRLKSLVFNTRLQGILIGLIATVMGMFGYQQLGPETSKVPNQTEETRSAELAALEDRLDALSRRIEDQLLPERITEPIVNSISDSAQVETIAGEAVARIAAAAKAEEIPGQAVDRIVEQAGAAEIASTAADQIAGAVNPEEVQDAVARKVAELIQSEDIQAAVKEQLGSPEFARSVSDKLKGQIEALEIPRAVEMRLTESTEFARKLAEAVKAAAESPEDPMP